MSFAALVAPNPHADRLLLRFHSSLSHAHRLTSTPPPDSALLTRRGVHLISLHKSIYSPTGLGRRHEAFASGVDVVVGRDVPRGLSLDAFLSIAEVLCIAPSLVLAVGGAIGCLLPRGTTPKLFQISSGNMWFVGQFFLLVGAAVIGGIIRQRQWRRISRDIGASGCDLIQRIEKVEEDLRSSATIVRVLSRQLEKLGIRFRVTRKTLKDPISETVVLAHKNSEATRALALQVDILEKELKEIQKVLLAMQEQQQKQLDLILTIAKAGKLFENKRTMPSGQDATGKINLVSVKKDLQQVEAQIGNNDKL